MYRRSIGIACVLGSILALIIWSAGPATASQSGKAGKAEAQPGAAAEAAAIRKVTEKEVKAINSGDAKAYAAICTDDAILMPDAGPAVKGKTAIGIWFKQMLDTTTVKLSETSEEVVVAGDWAWERFAYSFTMTPKDGGDSISDTGKGIHIYKKQADGSWRIHRDIWNSDVPAHDEEGMDHDDMDDDMDDEDFEEDEDE